MNHAYVYYADEGMEVADHVCHRDDNVVIHVPVWRIRLYSNCAEQAAEVCKRVVYVMAAT